VSVAPDRAQRCRAPLVIALFTALAAGGCAGPMNSTTLAPEETRARYLEMLAQRESGATALDAQASLWLRAPSAQPLPGVLADLAIGAPDAFRLRVHSALGTAFDLAGRGRALTAAVPSKRAYVEEEAAAESLGVRSPAELVVRACTADWRPPERAWQEATWGGTRPTLRWQEDADSIRVTLDAGGLPAEVEIERAFRGTVIIRYVEWGAGHPSWPVQIEVGDGADGAHLKCRLERVRVRAAADSARLAVAIPNGATRLAWSDAVRAFSKAVVP
jgi:hypothetical protein